MFSFKDLRQENVGRCKADFKTWGSISYFGMAAAGELGELLNLAKKIERHQKGGPDIGHSAKVKDITQEKLLDEFGGVLIYLDLLAAQLSEVMGFDINLEEAITKTFNRVSKEIGSSRYLIQR